ncbi:MAG TPA: ATP-binding protein [Gemmatimonadales bacterium]|nr:ATP-binding protein [Gemmatimonadales bacterium]
MNRQGWSWSGGGLRLRSVLLLLVYGAFGYMVVVFGLLAYRVGSAASELRRDSEPMLRLYGELTARAGALEQAVSTAKLLVEVGSGREVIASKIRAMVGRAEAPSPVPFARVPLRMRTELARVDELSSALQNRLVELVAAVELGRGDELPMRLAAIDSLHDELIVRLGEAQRIGLEDLVARERELDTTVQRATQDVLWWLAGGVLFVPVLVVVARRRIERPLRALEAGLGRVAEGELGVEIPVHRDDEIGRLARHFNQMTRVLRDRAEEQGRFVAAGELLAGVAHEVNNPLMAIVALSGNRATDPELAPELRAEMQQILRQGQRAGKLVAGLLRFVRSGDRHAGRVDVNRSLRDALDLVAYQFRVDEITLESRMEEDLPPIWGDALRLEQVCVNLLSNAIDALRQVRPPRRLLVATWAEAGRVMLRVADNGPGIPAAIAGRLFHPFVTSKGAQGTGLGLYISRQIVREMGGTLELESRPGQPASFLVSLPAAQREDLAGDGPAVEPDRPAARGLAGVRVLLVEDEEPLRRPMVKYLRRCGATVHEASDGLDALARLDALPVDVIVADLRMPRMDGVALHRALRQSHPALARRLLILSGDLSQLSAADGEALPRDRLLVKPITLEELGANVARVAATAG